MERINKETGELSASGELAVSMELKGEAGESGGVTGAARSPQLLLSLREHLHHLDTHTLLPLDQTHTPLPTEQREEDLLRVLSLYIQVQYKGWIVFYIKVCRSARTGCLSGLSFLHTYDTSTVLKLGYLSPCRVVGQGSYNTDIIIS